MTRDYKSRAQPHNRSKQQTPGWVWFISGLLIGLFFSGLIWLKLLPAPEQLAAKPAQISPVAVKDEKKEPREVEDGRRAAPKPRFDFYTILPETEVVVPGPEPDQVPDQERGKEPERKPPRKTTRITHTESKHKNNSGARYMLQMGSFRSYPDADRLKASLALVGIEAEIQRVNINSGEIFHRVRSGPYNKKKVNAIRNRLNQNSINSLVIRLK